MNFVSEEIEKDVLGFFIYNPEKLKIYHTLITEDHFYSEKHKYLYGCMRRLLAKGSEINAHTISAISKMDGRQDVLAWLSVVADCLPPADEHALIKMLDDVYRARRCYMGLVGAKQDKTEPTDFIAEAGKVVSEALLESSMWKRRKTLKEELREIYDEIERLQKQGGAVPGLPTGLKKLDEVIYGLRKGSLIIVAGRPGQGKSSLIIQIADGLAAEYHNVLCVTLEMTVQGILKRVLSQRTDIPGKVLSTGRMQSDYWNSLSFSIENLVESGWKIINPRPNLNNVEAEIRAEMLEKRYDLIVLDHVQCIRGEGKRREVIGSAAGLFKSMALEFDIPFVLVSQLNRQMVSEKPRRPRLSDLKETGDLEEQADVVMFVYRPGEYDKEQNKAYTELIISKNRDGETKIIRCTFEAAFTRFKEGVQGGTTNTDSE